MQSSIRLGPKLKAASSSPSAHVVSGGGGAAAAFAGFLTRQNFPSMFVTLSSPSNSSRFFWSSSSSSEAVEPEKKNDSSSTPLPSIPPLTPSNISATSLLSNSTIQSLKTLPEIASTLDIIYPGVSSDEVKNKQNITQLLLLQHSNLQRARDVLQSLPELHSSTYLISIDLYAHCGQFDLALESLTTYNHYFLQNHQHQMKLSKRKRVHLQFLKAKLYFLSGQFTHALSEYEDLLDVMEQDVQHQMKHQQKSEKERGVSVIDGAASLTGVGLTKLMMFLLNQLESDTDDSTITARKNNCANQILEAIETSTDMLLESRRDALHSPKHAGLAIDLGIAASISLTNLGVANCCLLGKKVESITFWKKGLDTLDALLGDAMNTATIIPRHKFQLMESIRARLHSDIACVLLDLVDFSSTTKKQLNDDTLKHASEVAKKGLDIYDELINGAKILRGESSSNMQLASDDENVREWERLLREEVKKKDEKENGALDPAKKPPEAVPLSPLWIDYHRCESARALGLVAHCYAQAGAAVTSEGLFQAALDASASYPFGLSLRRFNVANSDGTEKRKGIALSSPNLGLIARDVRLWYAMLCNNWEKRTGDAHRLLADAEKIDRDIVFRGCCSKKDQEERKKHVTGMVSSLWLFMPSDFESKEEA